MLEEQKPTHIISAASLRRQRDWSQETFGPGRRTKGVIDHIRKELDEIEEAAAGDDIEQELGEWIDVLVLGFDGALRTGASPQSVIDAYAEKVERNRQRKWPDWRTMSEDQAIEHIRDEGCPDCGKDTVTDVGEGVCLSCGWRP